MKYKAIIFDMDGTIVDTEKLWAQARHQVIANRNYKLSSDEYNTLEHRLAGLGLPQSCQVIKDLINCNDSLETLIEEKSAIACQLYQAGKINFIKGFPEFHKKVTSIPLKMSIATNATIEIVSITDKALNLKQYFGTHIYTINHVNNIGKPDPGVYLYAAKQLGIDPQHCIAIEDSAHGIKAAQAAGMFCIGINTSKKESQVKAADLIVENYDHIDLEKLIGNL